VDSVASASTGAAATSGPVSIRPSTGRRTSTLRPAATSASGVTTPVESSSTASTTVRTAATSTPRTGSRSASDHTGSDVAATAVVASSWRLRAEDVRPVSRPAATSARTSSTVSPMDRSALAAW
jgi:hypothetical protein